MRTWAPEEAERRVLASPIWIRLEDAFTGRPSAGPVTVVLERRDGAGWTPFSHPHLLGPAGDLAFVGLGRSAGRGGRPFDVRVGLSTPGTVAVASGGGPWVTTTVRPWTSEQAPVPDAPTVVQLVPGPEYAYPGGLPLLSGEVRDGQGRPVAAARIWSLANVQGVQRREEARTDARGWFRLPLRWSSGQTVVRAAEGGRQTAVTIDVPADLSTIQRMTLN